MLAVKSAGFGVVMLMRKVGFPQIERAAWSVPTPWKRLDAFEARVVAVLRRVSVPALRVSLGLVFTWFGALKLVGVTPVAYLITRTVPWVDASFLLFALGAFEVAVGLGLLVGRVLRLVLVGLILQMLGTFLVPVAHPEILFQGGNPLLLSTEGEFVLKNLVLLSAGLVVGAYRLRGRSGIM